jgi:type IV pilus assembly protein PilE
LIELMVTVAVIGILAIIAYPSYIDYIHRTNRSEGQAMLSDAAAREERYFSDNNQYTVAVTNLQYSSSPAISEHQYYSLAATSTDTSSRYTLTVTAQGAQCSDTTSSSKCDQKCYKMTLDNTGAKGSSDAGGNVNATEPGTCWK